MVTSQAKKESEEIINRFHAEKAEEFKARLADKTPFTDSELRYSAEARCLCGHGLAYPEACTPSHYWDCSAILKGIADQSVKHTDKLPFAFYEVKSESEHRGTTRPKECK